VLLAPLPRALKRRFHADLHATAADLARDAWRDGGARGLVLCLAREGRDALRAAVHPDSRLPLPHGDRAGRSLDVPDDAGQGWPRPTARGRVWFDLAADVRTALRVVRRRPVFAGSVVATLGLALCATLTVFALATAVLWRPLPFADEHRIAVLWEAVPERDGPRPFRVTSGNFVRWRDTLSSFESIAAFGAAGFTTIGAGEPAQIRGTRVTGDYFRALGLAPLLGRTIGPGDLRPGRHRVVVLAQALWQARFGGRASVVGSEVRLDDELYTVIGVMPAAVYPSWPVTPATLVLPPEYQQFWVPIPDTPDWRTDRRAHVNGVVARLRSGVSLERAREELASLAGRAGETGDDHGALIVPLRQQLTEAVRPVLLTLVAAVLVVLVMCCANLASLFVVHVDGRGRELAVRSAIGASDWRLARQLAIEALVLAAASTFAGLLATRSLLRVLPHVLPDSIPRLTALDVDWRVVAVGAALAVAVGLALAVWPISRVGRLRTSALRGGAAAVPLGGHRLLVVGEMALALVLAVAAGLLGRSLLNVGAQHPGFDVDRLLAFDVRLPAVRAASPADVVRFETELIGELQRLPGVRDVGVAYDNPLEANWVDVFSFVGEAPLADGDTQRSTWLRIVSPRYFATVGTRLVSGRSFDDADDLRRPGVALVNEAFARSFLADRQAIGTWLGSSSARLTWGEAAPSEFEIVGIVANERFRSLEEPAAPALYLSTRQFPQPGATVLVRTDGDPASLATTAARVVHDIDPEVPVARMTTMRDVLNEQLANRRLTTVIVAVFGGAALAVVAIGLYGLLSLVVASRVREIGVRMALGADPAAVAGEVVRRAVSHVAAGLVVGALGAWAATRLLTSLLYGVSPFDLATIGAAAVTLSLTAALVSWVPAYRAARIDPVRALRSE
jgi:predicted permease